MSIDFALERARRLIEGTRIPLLEIDSVVFGGCRFVGATLWTDFAVSVGDDEHIPPEERRVKAFELVPWRVMEFRYILRSDERRPEENGMTTIQEIFRRHIESRGFIGQEISELFERRTIVATHQAPLMQSFDPQFHSRVTNAAFASDLSSVIARRRPSVWIHGHIDKFRDFVAEKTRIISNLVECRGETYTSGFRPSFVIDL